MDLFEVFEDRVQIAVSELKNRGVLPADAELCGLKVEAPRDIAHGDISTNAAMVLAKRAGMKPRDLAKHIAELLRDSEGVSSVEVAGPGFINLKVDNSVRMQMLSSILRAGPEYGRCCVGKGQTVNVEYVSANPTGPMHVGHCRGAVFGDALASLLEYVGFEVTREYYVNDAGAQVDTLARSVFMRYREALGEDIGVIPEGLYPGGYLKPVGEILASTRGDTLLKLEENEWLPVVRDCAIESMMELIRNDLAALRIRHDVFFSERSLIEANTDKVAATISCLKSAGLIYEGRLSPPKGKQPEEWEDREQILFRSTDFGDDSDRALIKTDGSYTYFATDIAYHHDKYLRGFKTLIDVWGADHSGYVKRVGAAVNALSRGEAEFDVKICQLVRLLRSGEPVRMSKRAGTFITMRDVVEEVGPDPVRFMMLYRKNDAPLDFDFEKVMEQSKDNPVFYVQYAHARAYSVFRNADQVFPGILKEVDEARKDLIERLNDDSEVTLLQHLAQYPRLIQGAAMAHEPHRIAFYLYDLASEFHAHWNRGKDSPQLRFIRSNDRGLTVARLALVRAVAHIIASGLAILGVYAPYEMR